MEDWGGCGGSTLMNVMAAGYSGGGGRCAWWEAGGAAQEGEQSDSTSPSSQRASRSVPPLHLRTRTERAAEMPEILIALPLVLLLLSTLTPVSLACVRWICHSSTRMSVRVCMCLTIGVQGRVVVYIGKSYTYELCMSVWKWILGCPGRFNQQLGCFFLCFALPIDQSDTPGKTRLPLLRCHL